VTTTTTGRRGQVRARALAAAVAAAASAAALAACASASPAARPAAQPAAASGSAATLATSLSTTKDSWAIVPVSSNPTFWEVLVRPATSSTWQLVTPPGVADNGGLVAAAGTGNGLTVAVRPSQDLHFTPVASTADAGASWSTDGPISQGVASSPGALAVSGSTLAALLGNGTIEASSDAGASWRTLAKPGTIAASSAGQKCGTVGVSAVSFGPIPTDVLAAGRCGATGSAGFFSYSAGDGWQRLSLPVSGQLVRLGAGTALVRAKAGLTALWLGGWFAYAPLSPSSTTPSSASWTASAPLPVTNAVTASGGLAGATPTSSAGTWVLLPGGQAATIGGPGQQWLLLPPTPAHTSVLASGPGTSLDALAVSGDNLTVWQLDHRSTLWAKVQTISVPIQPGSSS
jgi:DNA segregation ATPase FtsK/SpoIIIE, S-DNA-T family